jgi:hypothetical protein
MRRLALVLVALLVAWPANAQFTSFQPAAAAGASYTGPGDITTMTAWYGLRAISGTAASSNAKLIPVKRISDNHTCDILAASTGGFGVTGSCSTGGDNGNVIWNGSTGFCDGSSGTDCIVDSLYDLTGGGRDVAFSGTIHPALVKNCLNTSLPCIQQTLGTGASQQYYASASNFTPATGTNSASMVVNRSAGTTVITWVTENAANNNNQHSANQYRCVGGSSGLIAATASDANWHAQACIMQGSGSLVVVDGSASATDVLTGSTTANKIFMVWNSGSSGNVGKFAEGGFADNVAWSATVYGNLHTNQSAYWGTP